ncbi:sre G protein-coupled chemoreceptor domain-containing protein [Ditylenchus destructor]|uniref:Sre G protein-coupled chemoreceptor domain-containing protein n=1 Tax=Ditylenchus destructor TaxID=166010 RepID=A0AAD4MVX0_9BILA|nr:sre G protein-coupled chemoreceptor domain-containing protein [Ditylenchus destructor]
MALPNSPREIILMDFSNHSQPGFRAVALLYAELGFHAIAIPLNTFFVILLIKHGMIHTNLRGVYAISLIIGSLARIPIIVINININLLFQIDRKAVYFYYIHDVSICNHLFIMIPITVERIIATMRSKHYEKETRPFFGIISTFIMQICSYGVCVNITEQIALAELIGNQIVYIIPHFPLIMIGCAIAVFCITVICVVKYQYSENIRTSAQLVPLIVISLICNTLITITWFLSFQFTSLNYSMKQAQDIILAISSVTIPITAIFFHPFLRRAALRHLHHRNKSHVGSEEELPGFSKNGPKSLITGEQLIVRREQERDLYFENLRKSWS